MSSPVVDIHAHFYPQRYLDVLAGYGYPHGTTYATAAPDDLVGSRGRRYGVHDAAFTDITLRLERMDRQGVDVHALSLPPPDAFGFDPGLLEGLCRTFNDAASTTHSAHPTRFVALAALPVHSASAAITELQRAQALPGIRGVCLGTRFCERELSDPAFVDLWDAISGSRLPVFLHYAPLMVVGTPERLKTYHLGNVIGNTTETAIAAAHLIFGSILDRCPALEISLPHAGGVLPILAGRLDRAHAVRDECRHLARPPSAYLRRFRYDTVCHAPAILDFLIDLVGADRIMLGSDYCFDMGVEHPRGIVQQSHKLDAAERAAVLGATAARLLALA